MLPSPTLAFSINFGCKNHYKKEGFDKVTKTHARFSKQISLLTVIVMLLSLLLFLPVSAEETKLANLLPSNKTERGSFTSDGCTLKDNADGSVTLTLTATTATFTMTFTEGLFAEGGGTIYCDEPINLTNPAYVVYDYASADGVTMPKLIAHYTRKDKAATSILADLYLTSMEDTVKYPEYSKQAGAGFGVWDWGKYVTTKEGGTCLFDDKTHRFASTEGSLDGKVGAKITLYSLYVSSSPDVVGLGTTRPEPTVFETSTASQATSTTESVVSTAESSVATSSTTSSVTSKETSNNSTSSKTESKATTASSKSDTSSQAEDDGLEPIYYILIIAAAIIIIGGVVFFVMKKKK